MKTWIGIGVVALLTGCAHYSSEENSYRGSPGSRPNVQTGATDEDYFPYRSGPGLPSTDRAFPRRIGPGELGQ